MCIYIYIYIAIAYVHYIWFVLLLKSTVRIITIGIVISLLSFYHHLIMNTGMALCLVCICLDDLNVAWRAWLSIKYTHSPY